MDEQLRAELATSFGAVADVYARARPTYPVAAVRWLAGSTPRRVLDLGAGTGRLTQVLLDQGHRVLAVDPSVPMLAHLAGHTACPIVAGAAEQIPVHARMVDAVVVAQAFHWFDHDRAVPEIARVLRPGGVVALVWNQRDESVPWVRTLGQVMGATPDLPDPGAVLGLSGAFGPLEHARFRMWQRLDRQGLLDLVRSRSYVSRLPADERNRVLSAVGELYDTRCDDPLGLQMPYHTLCFRAVRR